MFTTAFGVSMNTLKCSHEIHYQSLFDAGRSLCFPCDINGHVPLDSLSERGLADYLYARAVVGKEFAFPLVTPSSQH